MTYLDDIVSDSEFQNRRSRLIELMQKDEAIYLDLMRVFVDLMKYEYVSSKNWSGVPIVKLPEDIVVIQEFHFEYRPTAVIEIGVARGGSVALAISMQKLNGITPNVLGIDIKILEHTKEALVNFEENGWLKLVETDSTSGESLAHIRSFIQNHQQVFVILDSNHAHEHVIRELELIDKVLPVGSVVLVADGIIEHIPEREDRPWGPGNSPLTAVNQFLKTNVNWKRLEKYSRRSIFSEFRDGWIIKQ